MKTLRSTLADGSVRFGTSGLRGLVTDLTREMVVAATQAFLASGLGGTLGSKIAVGHDLRPSSPQISSWVVEALLKGGYTPVFCGAVPTPALALYAMADSMGAIMVTGSHIPFDRNGIKFYTSAGEITKTDEAAILDVVIGDAASSVNVDLERAMVSHRDAAEALYQSRYKAVFAGLLQGQRVGIHQHSAVGRDLLVEMVRDLGGHPFALGRSESFVPVDTEALDPADEERAISWVKEHDLDALITTDGDGDRPLLADETGRFFRGDELCMLAAAELGSKAVVTPVTSLSSAETSGFFEVVKRTQVGSPHVLEAMAQLANHHDGIIGYEANGGLLVQQDMKKEGEFLARLPTRDSALPVLAVIARAKSNGVPLSQLRAQLPQRGLISLCVRNVASEVSRNFLEELNTTDKARHFFEEIADPVRLDTTDGMRFYLTGEQVVHVRPSGNAPELRLYVEAKGNDEAMALANAVRAKIEQRLHR